MNEKNLVNAIITSINLDVSRGLKKDEVLRSLSNVISKDLFAKVRDQL